VDRLCHDPGRRHSGSACEGNPNPHPSPPLALTLTLTLTLTKAQLAEMDTFFAETRRELAMPAGELSEQEEEQEPTGATTPLAEDEPMQEEQVAAAPPLPSPPLHSPALPSPPLPSPFLPSPPLSFSGVAPLGCRLRSRAVCTREEGFSAAAEQVDPDDEVAGALVI
jgi:hypothetical protein